MSAAEAAEAVRKAEEARQAAEAALRRHAQSVLALGGMK